MVLAVAVRCVLGAWIGEEVRWVKVNITFENFEVQEEVSPEVAAFQREEVNLTKPFFEWHLTKAYH